MGNLFSEINVKSVKESFTDDMLHKIISGRLKPGDRLPPEREIAAETGISRSVVNQSLLQLESMGFVQIKPRHGTVVADFMKNPTPQSIDVLMRYGSSDISEDLLLNMVDFRILIEKESAKLACTNAYESTLEKMEELLDLMGRSAEESAKAQYAFHYRLTQASGNLFLSVIFSGFESMIKVLIKRHYELCPKDLKTVAESHRKLLTAIRNKDEEAAQQLAEAIIHKGREVLKK
ncbi:MAG: FadR family transcriptional regulator [Lachnospiraceae bacterium]|nr:FadR family transcriptional regulator [Lachnospiraceae bacterium]